MAKSNLNRHDRITGENINIKPQPALGEKTERYNWDSPILGSPHNPKQYISHHKEFGDRKAEEINGIQFHKT